MQNATWVDKFCELQSKVVNMLLRFYKSIFSDKKWTRLTVYMDTIMEPVKSIWYKAACKKDTSIQAV